MRILFGFTEGFAFAMTVHLFESPYFRSAMSASVSPDWTTYSSFAGAGSTGGGGWEGAVVDSDRGPGEVTAPAPFSRCSASPMISPGERGGASVRRVTPESWRGAVSVVPAPGFGFPYIRS